MISLYTHDYNDIVNRYDTTVDLHFDNKNSSGGIQAQL